MNLSRGTQCAVDTKNRSDYVLPYQLDKLQRGQKPDDFKPMPVVGKGVEEIRVWDDSGTYRVVYTARLADAVYVLHSFHKKTQLTPRRDIGYRQSTVR